MIVAGGGPGNPKYLTRELVEAIEGADKVLAFTRLADSLGDLRQDIIRVQRVDQIIDLINPHEEVLIVVSGDPCFYGLVEYLKKKNIAIKKIMPGLSSFQYMMARLGLSWQGANLISLHGRKEGLESVLGHKLSIILTDRGNTPSSISKDLEGLGVSGRIYAGFNLSYKDEKIIKARIGDLIDDLSPLAVVVVENEMD